MKCKNMENLIYVSGLKLNLKFYLYVVPGLILYSSAYGRNSYVQTNVVLEHIIDFYSTKPPKSKRQYLSVQLFRLQPGNCCPAVS